MSFFSYDSKQAGGSFEPLTPGEYEVVISDAEVKTFSSGSEGIKLTLTIRDDVDQEGQKRKVFDNLIAMEKTMFKFHNLAKGLGWGEGEQRETLKDFANAVRFASVKVKLKVKPASGQYPASNEVVTYLPSDIEGFSGSFGGDSSNPFADQGKPIDISDDDLPF